MNPHDQADLLTMAARAAASDNDRERKLSLLAGGIDDLWDRINPHNAMEYAQVVSIELPTDERARFGEVLRSVLSVRADFQQELDTNSASHCLKHALDGTPDL